MAADDTVLRRARFDPRLKTYWMLQVQVALLVTFFGIPLMPLWYLFGREVHRRQYEALECELTSRTLNVRKGFLFRVQKNVPLDKVTDLALNEGPILRYLGLCSLTIETAGGGAGTTTGQAGLVGVEEAVAFRDAVLAQRDRVALGGAAAAPVAAAPAAGRGDAELELLTEIRDGLARIEGLLERKDA